MIYLSYGKCVIAAVENTMLTCPTWSQDNYFILKQITYLKPMILCHYYTGGKPRNYHEIVPKPHRGYVVVVSRPKIR